MENNFQPLIFIILLSYDPQLVQYVWLHNAAEIQSPMDNIYTVLKTLLCKMYISKNLIMCKVVSLFCAELFAYLVNTLCDNRVIGLVLTQCLLYFSIAYLRVPATSQLAQKIFLGKSWEFPKPSMNS